MKAARIGRQDSSLFLVICLFITCLIMLPVANLIVSSLTTTRFGFYVGLTLANYYAAYTDPRFIPTLLNSAVYAVGSTFLGLSIATAIAWIVTRTNTPLKGLTELMPLLPLLLPPMMDTIAWIFLIAPRAGILNHFLAETFGIGPVFNAFSLPAMIWVFGLSEVPLMYLIILPSFLSTDPTLEETAYMSGASPLKTLRLVTLPLSFPVLLSAMAVGLLHAVSSFETPTLQGIPGGIPVFISLIYDAAELEFNYGLAVAYATTLLILTLYLVWFYLRVTRIGDKYAAVTAKGTKPRIIDIGNWRFVALTLVLLYFAVAIILPFGVVFITSVIPTFTYEFFKDFSAHLTAYNYAMVLGSSTFLGGMINSLYVGLATALITVFTGALMSYIIHRTSVRGRRVFEAVGTIPLGFPGLVLSLGLLLAYLGTPLYNSVLGILAAFVIFYLPYALRITSGALLRIHREIDEAARVHGASWWSDFTRITLPHMTPALATSCFYVFISAYRQIGAAVLLTGPGTSYGAVTLFEFYTVGQWAEAAAGSMIYAVLLLTFMLLAKYVLKVGVRL